MKIEHVALWTKDLEGMKAFYGEYFGATAGEKYHNQKTGFQSYFLSFASGARLEIMTKPGMQQGDGQGESDTTCFSHLAFSVGSKEAVDTLTDTFREKGFQVLSGPRATGDGYYESCILDPEGNRIEITV